MVRGEEFYEEALAANRARERAKVTAKVFSKQEKKDRRKRNLFGIFSKVFIAIVVIGIVFSAAFFGWKWYQSGIGSTEYKKGLVAVKESGAPKIFGFWDVITNPDELRRTYSLETEVIDEDDSYESNLEIRKYESVRGKIPYEDGEVIQVLATVLASTKDEPTELEIGCFLENYEGEISVFPSEKITITNTRPELYDLTCRFVDPYYTDKTEDALQSKIRLTYDHTTESVYKAYFITEEKRKSIGNQDFFVIQGIQEPLLETNNVMKSQYTPGPLKVVIGSQRSQPFVEGTDFAFLLIKINSQDDGAFRKINKFELKLPNPIELESGDDNVCSFELVGSDYNDENYNIYALKPSLISEISRECDVGRLGDECRDKRKELIYGCGFRVNELPLVEDAGYFYTNFVLKMNYEYDLEKSTIITVQRDIAIES